MFFSFVFARYGLAISTSIEKSYYLLIFFCLLSTLISYLVNNFYFINNLLILVKYTLPVTIFSIVFFLNKYLNQKYLNYLYNSQLIFVFITGGYVLFNHIFYPQDIVWLSGSYTQEYRLVGYTGHVFDNYHIERIGNTSVNMGVYISLLLFISIQKLIYKQNLINYSIVIALFICLLFTYSRSGLLAFFPGLILLAILNLNKR